MNLKGKLIVVVSLCLLIALIASGWCQQGIVTFSNLRIMKIKSESMAPTLESNSRVLVQIHPVSLDRYDIIAFKPSLSANEMYIGRIVGLSGEIFEITKNEVNINGFLLKEDYLEKSFQGKNITLFSPYKIPPESYFILCDNRIKGYDSRNLGSVHKTQIVAKVILSL
jgi:signal peptidase I